jgi:hypothetical protein
MHASLTSSLWCGLAVRFRVLNHRADMQFILVTNLTSWLGGFIVLAKSLVIRPANPNMPMQGHLARTKDAR